MKITHPNMDEQRIEQMYQDCHSSSDEKFPMNNKYNF